MVEGSVMVLMDVSKEHTHDDNKQIRAKRTALPYTTLLKVFLRSELIMLKLKGRVSIQSLFIIRSILGGMFIRSKASNIRWWFILSNACFQSKNVNNPSPPLASAMSWILLAINTGRWVERELLKPYWVLARWGSITEAIRVRSIEVNIP